MQIRPITLVLPCLLGLLACGGGQDNPVVAPAPAPKATALRYQDPTGTGWRFLRDTSSTSTRLVLNLVGPAGLKTRGVGFHLKAPVGIAFGSFPGGLGIQDAGVYQLGTWQSQDGSEPLAIASGRMKDNVLAAGLFQKDRDQGAQDSGAVLCRIALELDTKADVPAGTTLPLSILKAKVIPEDIGEVIDDLWTKKQKMRMKDIAVTLGTLTAQ